MSYNPGAASLIRTAGCEIKNELVLGLRTNILFLGSVLMRYDGFMPWSGWHAEPAVLGTALAFGPWPRRRAKTSRGFLESIKSTARSLRQ